ncbi:MAG: cupin domain-containing protein [Gammaproteobacteria bacterium]
MVKTALVTDIDISESDMLKRVARFAEQKSTAKAFIDTRIPGHERDIYTIIGGGVLEDPDIAPPIAAQDIHFAIVACDPGKGAAMHSHLTEEIFMPLTGEWEIRWGPEGKRTVVLKPWDVISVPVQVMRGFRNVGSRRAHLLALVGGHDPGRVGWPDSMKEMARTAGLVIDDNGDLREVAPAKA